MLNEVFCPKCQSKLRSNNDLTGKTVRCSKCQERFVASEDIVLPVVSQGDTQMLSAMEIAAIKPKAVPVKSALESMDDMPVLDAMPAARPVAKAVPKVVAVPVVGIPAAPASSNAFAFDEAPVSPKKRKPADEEADEDEEPRPKKKSRPSDDEQDTVVDQAADTAVDAFSFDAAPVPASKKSKRRIDEDDDEVAEEKPKKGKGKPAKKGPPVMLLAGIAVGFLFLAGGGVAAYFLLIKKSVAKAPTSAAAKAPAATPEPTKATKAETKSTGNTDVTPPKPETPGKKQPPPKGGPKTPPAGGGPKSNLPKAPAADAMLVSAIKEKFTIDAAPESIKAFRIVGEGPDRKIFIARNTFAGFQGQGAVDTIERYAIDSGAKIGSCEVKADGVKWPRPFEASPDGKHLVVEGPAGKLSLYSFEENKYLLEAADPFAGNANRKGPLKGLNWKGNDTFYVSDHNGSTDEWSVANKKLKKAGPNLPDADAGAKVIVHPLDDNGELLAVLRDSQVFVLRGGNPVPASLPEATAVPIALAGSTLADRVKMAVVAQIKDTTQYMVYILNFKDQVAPISIRLPDGIGTVTDIGWQSVDSLIVTIEGGAAALVIDLEEQYPVAYVKSPAAKAQMFGKATFNSLWYAVADSTGKTQIGGVNLDFDGYKKMAEDAKGNKMPAYIVPGEKGISK